MFVQEYQSRLISRCPTPLDLLYNTSVLDGHPFRATPALSLKNLLLFSLLPLRSWSLVLLGPRPALTAPFAAPYIIRLMTPQHSLAPPTLHAYAFPSHLSATLLSVAPTFPLLFALITDHNSY